jgi:hypothetical protein
MRRRRTPYDRLGINVRVAVPRQRPDYDGDQLGGSNHFRHSVVLRTSMTGTSGVHLF